MLHVGKPLHLSLFLVDLLKFCCRLCDLDFVHSNFKVIQYLMLIIAFKLVLSHSSQNFVAALQSGHTVFSGFLLNNVGSAGMLRFAMLYLLI